MPWNVFNESHNILNYFPDLSFPRGRPLTVEGVGWGDFFSKNLNILRTDLEDDEDDEDKEINSTTAHHKAGKRT